MPKTAYYPYTVTHFVFPDGESLPALGIAIGSHVYTYPSGNEFIWTGHVWEAIHPQVETQIVALLLKILSELSAIRQGAELITDQTLKG